MLCEQLSVISFIARSIINLDCWLVDFFLLPPGIEKAGMATELTEWILFSIFTLFIVYDQLSASGMMDSIMG